jgi:Zn-dependent protease
MAMENVWPSQPLPQPSEPERPSPSPSPRWRGGLGGLAVAAVAIAAKGKALLLLLPKLKILTTSGTMLVSMAAYALFWGFPFAAGFVVLLLIHEMGHVIQLRREGVKATAPIFIPFLGAAVGMKEMPRDALAEARVGLAGPVLGTLGAAIPAAIGFATGEDFWLALAFVGFFLNLFNLMPVLPLDGGRAMAAMAPWMWFAGFAGMVVAAFVWPNPILILILLLGGLETWRRWRARKSADPGEQRYYEVPPRKRLAVAAVYLGLIVVLAAGMAQTFVERSL